MALKTETNTRKHVLVGNQNPYLRCSECHGKVPYWHDPSRCDCKEETYNYPCGHVASTYTICHSWGPIDGCRCKNKETHDK